MISCIGNKKIGKFSVSGAYFHLESHGMIDRSLGVDRSINITWIDGAL